MKFLVADDSSTMRRIIVNSLNALGHTDIVEAEDGAEALKNTTGVDFILTDWNMPNMDGLTFVKAVREKDKKTPIVMITTEAAKDDVITAIKNGVTNYIVKPFTMDTLKAKLEKIIK
ncbi:MAG: response regulator [Candidatus Aureabacteria bacterium]|nr:response regulator [Candidatus Auribacterota bacterium]